MSDVGRLLHLHSALFWLPCTILIFAASSALYRRLGFTVGARNRHPWGTHNQIIQLPGFFVELLTVAEPDKLGDDGLGGFGDRSGDRAGRQLQRHAVDVLLRRRGRRIIVDDGIGRRPIGGDPGVPGRPADWSPHESGGGR